MPPTSDFCPSLLPLPIPLFGINIDQQAGRMLGACVAADKEI